MIVTESALREQLRHPRTGATVRVPAGATLSPAAADFVAQWRLVVHAGEADTGLRPGVAPSWDRPSSFPVASSTQTPRCTCCGGEVTDKPDALTQLNSCHFALKTAPRIRLRGRIDSLQAYALLAGAHALAEGHRVLAGHLDTVAAYCRELLSAEYNERPAAAPEIDGQDEQAVHRATHDPRGTLGIDHLAPSVADPEVLHHLNVLRCQVREVELVALEVFDSPHHPFGASIVHGLNRLSSTVYYLELRLMREGGTW